MSFVKEIDEEGASGALRRVYDAATARAGSVSNVLRTMSLDAKALNASMAFYVTLMKSKNALDPVQREMIATVVSNANNCFYCTLSHGEDFAIASENKKLAESLIYDYRNAGLEEKDRALCDFAIKLTLDPGGMNEDDIDELRSHGFNDEATVVTCQVVGYINYINRIANALGTEDEIWMKVDPEEWEKKKGRGYLETVSGGERSSGTGDADKSSGKKASRKKKGAKKKS